MKWGILGLGRIAAQFAQDLQLVDNAILHAVASRTEAKSKSFASAHDAEKYYDSYHDLLADQEVDIVYIATPHNAHMEWAIKAMEAGKHVLCEKPLAVNRQQVQSMIEASQANNVFMMEAFWTRFNPSVREIILRVKDGELGEVNFINADFSFPTNASPESRLFNLELAGGSLLDIGVYPLFLAYVLMGMPNEINASAVFHETGADEQMSAILKYDQGIAVTMSGFKSQSDMVARIYGSDGSILIDPHWHQTDGYTMIRNNKLSRHVLPPLGKGFTYEIMECHQCLSKGKIESELWSHKDSLNLIQITDKIRKKINLHYPFE
ncbi:MAG: Gfo/Idh/MocA family oxidoreductase [Saprospiraceae bacterium]|nr:Gfo/Idh/MocA family oxidoreductase [Saprospiraceae bacterium]